MLTGCHAGRRVCDLQVQGYNYFWVACLVLSGCTCQVLGLRQRRGRRRCGGAHSRRLVCRGSLLCELQLQRSHWGAQALARDMAFLLSQRSVPKTLW